jgi:diguanylate cyclase (GGDEF)-like protein
VSLVDVDRQWFKSMDGLDVGETPRDVAFCAHTILTRDALNVADAHLDPRFAGNALVTGEPHIRAYLGAPLKTPDGYNVGALCAIDSNPRSFGPADEAVLASFAALVVDELELRMIGQSDYLTGAKTRRAFMADLEAACEQAPGSRGALILLDLDHFKRVNDRFGHPVGDDVLRAAAAACRGAIRRADVLGRLGGEEFAILLRGMTISDAMECAERVRQSVAELRVLPDPELEVTVCMGVAALTGGNPHAALAAADAALYRAKEGGRNRCLAATGISDDRPILQPAPLLFAVTLQEAMS